MGHLLSSIQLAEDPFLSQSSLQLLQREQKLQDTKVKRVNKKYQSKSDSLERLEFLSAEPLWVVGAWDTSGIRREESG